MRHLRWIGVILFVWILSRIDRTALLSVVRAAPVHLLLVVLVLLLAQLLAKALRWHLLMKSRGLASRFVASWRVYVIGIFFGVLTPSNLGELGRVPYLMRAGLSAKSATALVIYDRLADVSVIGMFGIAAVGVLFGLQIFLVTSALFCIGGIVIGALWWSTTALRDRFGLEPYDGLLQAKTLVPLFSTSVLAWCFYFAWTVLAARATGIMVPLPELLSALTLTGVAALLPISPSGLGTREAALLTLLGPLGVESVQSVALSLLILLSTLVVGVPGLFYWVLSSRRMEDRAGAHLS